LLPFAVTVSACSSTYIVRCKDGDHLAIHDSLYFGTAKPGGVVSSEDWAKFLETTVTPRFPKGLTSSRVSGQWRGDDGEIVRADSHVLQLLHPDDATTEKAIRELAETYKTQFKQQAVMRIVPIRARHFSSPFQQTLHAFIIFADSGLLALSPVILVEPFNKPARLDLPHNLVRDELFRIGVFRRGNCG
jgi:Protein of unknown function (DUF3574)